MTRSRTSRAATARTWPGSRRAWPWRPRHRPRPAPAQRRGRPRARTRAARIAGLADADRGVAAWSKGPAQLQPDLTSVLPNRIRHEFGTDRVQVVLVAEVVDAERDRPGFAGRGVAQMRVGVHVGVEPGIGEGQAAADVLAVQAHARPRDRAGRGPAEFHQGPR